MKRVTPYWIKKLPATHLKDVLDSALVADKPILKIIIPPKIKTAAIIKGTYSFIFWKSMITSQYELVYHITM